MSRIQQSDITITPEGKVFISFLWDDLVDLVSRETTPRVHSTWEIPVHVEFTSTEEYKRCYLCPKQCGFDRTRYTHPSCGDAKFRVSNVGISFGDEALIRGNGGSGCIMLSGCPLTCPSCHNPEKVAEGRETTTAEFLSICQELLNQGAENIQILSPTVHIPALFHNLRILKASKFPLPIVMKSSGYESVEQLKRFSGLVDVWLPDFKFGPCSNWGRRSGVADYFEMAKLSLCEMVAQVGTQNVLVRHVMAPLPENERSEIIQLIESLKVPLSLDKNFVNLE